MAGGIYPGFNLSTQQAENLVKSGDGMKPYAQGTGWEAFPEKKTEQYEISYKKDLALMNGDAFVKKAPDNNLDDSEKQLMQAQLNWDISGGAKQATPEEKQGKAVTPEIAKNALNFIQTIFKQNENLDLNGDGKFNEKDVSELAKYDGDASNVTSKDMEALTEAQIKAELQKQK